MKIYIDKENTLQIDENAKLILLNVDEFVSTLKRESGFVPAGHIRVSLKYKLVHNNNEYVGESIFDSYKDISNTIDDNSPYKVELINWKLSDKDEKYLEFNFTKLNNQTNTLHFELMNKKNGYEHEISYYNYNSKENIKNIKLQICYYICNSNKIDLLNVHLDSHDEEIGVANTIIQNFNAVNFKEKFKSVDLFCETYKDYPDLVWEIRMKYCETEISISSVYLESAISIMCPLGSNIDLMPLLQEVENNLLETNDYK